MKICFVLEYYYPHIGGAENLFKNLAEGLVKNGHSCSVITSKVTNSKSLETINGVCIHRIKVPRFFDRYWFTFLAIPKVFKIARSFDILHTTTYNGTLATFIVGKALRKKIIITVLEVLHSYWKTLSNMNIISACFHMFIEKIIISLPFDKYVCISQYTKNNVKKLKIKESKLSVIYPGIDKNIFKPQNNGNGIKEKLNLKDYFIYLSFGRPGFFKGIEYLIKAVPLISKEIPGSKLILILSDKPVYKYKQILALIKRMQIGNSLILLESLSQQELLAYISCSDCVVLPSLSEGFGFTCIEATTMGKPVVATNVGAIPEVISGKYILISPQSEHEICRGVRLAYTGKFEDHPPKTFNWENCIDQYISIYKNLLSCVNISYEK